MNHQTEPSGAPDLSEALGKLLSDPEAVAKAMEMAKKLSESADLSALSGLMQPAETAPEDKEKEPVKSVRTVRAEDRVRLLNALKPYLSKRSAERIDTVISLSKLAEIAETLGIRLI